MKKWGWALAALLAAAALFITYRILTPSGSTRQLKLWYCSDDFSPAVMELLAESYNRQRQAEDDPVRLRAFATEAELADAFQQGQPDLLLCSYDRAANLGSRELLAEVEGADWDYLPEIEDSLPYAGRSFYPLGSATPVLVYNTAALAEAGISADFSSLEALCATAEAYREKTGKPFFTVQSVTPLLAAWAGSLGYELHGDGERDALNASFCRVYNQLAQCVYEGSALPPTGDAPGLVETGEPPCALLSSTRAVTLAEGCAVLPLPLPSEGQAVYVPEIMGLAVTGANSYALPSAKAFLLWLREHYTPWDALALGLVPTGAAVDCQPDLPLSQLLMEIYVNRQPLLYSPFSDYMQQRQEMEKQLSNALDLLY